jgi:hypothetical protein
VTTCVRIGIGLNCGLKTAVDCIVSLQPWKKFGISESHARNNRGEIGSLASRMEAMQQRMNADREERKAEMKAN